MTWFVISVCMFTAAAKGALKHLAYSGHDSKFIGKACAYILILF